MKMMLQTSNYVLILCLSFFAFYGFAFGQELPTEVVTNEDFIKLLIESIGGIKGASTLAIVGIVVKLLLALFSSEFFDKIFHNFGSGAKLTIVLALSLISGVAGLMATTNISLGAALVHASTLSAFVVLSNQIYKQYFEKK